MYAQDWTSTYKFETIKYPGDTFTQTLGINNSDTIAGYHGTTVNKGFTRARSGTFTNENFPNSSQTQVIGINNDDKTSGFYIDANGKTHGFTDFRGIFLKVDYPGTSFNQLLSQNDVGQAAGYYSTKADGTGTDHAYIYDEFGGVLNCSTFLVLPAHRRPGSTIPAGFADSSLMRTGSITAGFWSSDDSAYSIFLPPLEHKPWV
jgi:hypothetical protein